MSKALLNLQPWQQLLFCLFSGFMHLGQYSHTENSATGIYLEHLFHGKEDDGMDNSFFPFSCLNDNLGTLGFIESRAHADRKMF